jgi:Metallo-peptidase family M12B Reprolysin-like/Secretion system C-terminal sorting domain
MKKIYKLTFTFLFLLSLSASLVAQNSFFAPKNESSIFLGNNKREIIPAKYQTFGTDITQLKNFLWSLPSEKNVIDRNTAPVMTIPMPDGSMARFHVWESNIMEPELAAKFPEMRQFLGQGIDDPYATIRFDYNPYTGFHAQILSSQTGRIYIDPYAKGDFNNYISYFNKDNNRNPSFKCEVVDNPSANKGQPAGVTAAVCLGTNLRTYRLALACTGEYAVAVAGANPTVPAVAAAMLTSVNRVTGVYELEVSLRMVLIANNDLLIYLNGATDPYTNNNGGAMLGENQANVDAVIGSPNYDIGHVFSTGGGGIASLNSPCNAGSKARGVTGSSNPVGDGFDIDYVAHEMGHQWGGNHSMAGCGSSPASTKFEVGSGTSIQAYAGICGAENIQPNSDPYFHGISFDEISNYITTGGGNSCGVSTATGNTLPVINTLPNNNLSIPPSTPFTLTATATDANNDPLTYCWEGWNTQGTQTWNAGATAPAGNTVPLFKSRVPKTTGTRTFPDIAVILANYPANPPSAMNGLKGETLSPVARPMNFRLTVRDNRAGGGGVVSSGGAGCQTSTPFLVTVVGSTPFTVTSPNGGENYNGGTTQTVTWNVAGTNNAPVSVANVRITLSTDGGLTYPTELLASTANDGTEAVTLPNVTTTTARVRVEAVGNIFFDISNANFNITTVSNPTFTFVTPAPATVACGSASAAITLATTSVMGFVTPINLVASGLPGGTNVTYSVNPVTPGNSTVVTLNNMNALAPGTYNITITGTAGAEVKTVQLTYIVSPGAGPAITGNPTPQTVCAGSNTSFTVTSPSATAFQWQLSTTGAGGPWSNISNGGVYSGATTATLNITGALATMDGYQYRAVASVTCGSSNSNPALLTVQSAPNVTASPTASTVCAGNSTSFTASAAGTGLTYQWQVSTTGCGGTFTNLSNTAPYSGVNTTTLTINPTSAALNGYAYRLVVSGTCGSPATSGCAGLTVNTPIAISADPVASTVCAGANTSFSVTATGTTPTYQWQLSTTGAGGPWSNISNGGVYSGATSSTLSLTGATAGMTGYQYRVVVNGAAPCASATSNPAALTVNTAPVITANPAASTTLCVGGNVTYTVAASGTGVGYQWQVSTAGAGGPWTNLANGGVYSGVNTASLTITGATAAMNTYQYRAVATGTCAPAANSNAAALTVNTPITITTQPNATTNICATGTTSFTVVAAGTSPTYQWQMSTDGGANWTTVTNGGIYSGATTGTLTLTSIPANVNGTIYRAVVTGAAPCGSVNSNNAVLNVTPQPVITASPMAILAGQQTILTVNVTPAPGLTFAWYLNGVLVPNATGNSIVANVNSLGNYRVVVTSGTGSCQSELKEITALPSTKLFIFPSPNDGRFTITYYTDAPYPVNPKKTQSINIYDSYGRLVLRKTYEVSQAYQLHKMDLRQMGSGVYYVVLRDANGNKVKTGEVVVR